MHEDTFQTSQFISFSCESSQLQSKNQKMITISISRTKICEISIQNPQKDFTSTKFVMIYLISQYKIPTLIQVILLSDINF